jgi:hypothetical protein
VVTRITKLDARNYLDLILLCRPSTLARSCDSARRPWSPLLVFRRALLDLSGHGQLAALEIDIRPAQAD